MELETPRPLPVSLPAVEDDVEDADEETEESLPFPAPAEKKQSAFKH